MEPNSGIPMGRQARQELIRAIETMRQSHVVTYVVGDRPGTAVQIGEDAVRPMYDHIRTVSRERQSRIDLFLYSRGGGIEVPWRIVSMFREYCSEFCVIVPYKAYSAATLIALGADQIIMGPKGELGPIDPQVSRVERGEKTVIREELGIEDVMSYVAFVKERGGLSDQTALSSVMSILADKLTPWKLGQIYRAYSHIRLIARKLIASRREPPEEQRVNLIIDSLAEKMYYHGHGIGRKEAEDIGLPVVKPDAELDATLWQLLEAYEEMLKLKDPFDPESSMTSQQDEYTEHQVLAAIESADHLHVFGGDMKLRRIRQTPPQLHLNLNLALQLPPNLQPGDIPAAAQELLRKMVEQLQAQIPGLVQAELQRQAPVTKTEAHLCGAAWYDATARTI